MTRIKEAQAHDAQGLMVRGKTLAEAKIALRLQCSIEDLLFRIPGTSGPPAAENPKSCQYL